ncbi:MAG: hypothetical protein AAFR37_12525 [Cyanobacteria bacterium J06628_3]
MNYLIAVYPNRFQALSAFTALKKESFPSEQISILGQGYKNTTQPATNPQGTNQ